MPFLLLALPFLLLGALPCILTRTCPLPCTCVSTAAQLAESARIGTAVLGVLQSQRRSLEGAVNRQTQAAGELEQTSSIMTQMWQRVKRKRWFCMSIAALLFAAIILMLWFKLVVWSHGSTSASGSGGST